MSDLLGNVQNKPTLLVYEDNREIISFTVSLTRPMGLKRAAGKRSFIDSVLQTLDDFYGDVVQRLREWQPPAPKLRKSDSSTELESENVEKSGAEAEPVPIPRDDQTEDLVDDQSNSVNGTASTEAELPNSTPDEYAGDESHLM